jgi:2-octaprenyl-6-methoxyphenol hydroxylase
MHKKDNIVILGCGFIGMITALSLANRGIKTTIFEKQSIDDLRAIKDERNIAITCKTRKWLILNKIWNLLEPYIASISDVYIVDNKDEESILNLDSKDHSVAIGYMIMSKDLQRILFDLVINNKNIELVTSSPYKDINSEANQATIIFNDKQLVTRLLLVCDGKNSHAMQKYSSYFIKKDYQQKALVFTVSHEKPHENSAVEHFLSSGVFAILPTINQYQSSIVWIENKRNIWKGKKQKEFDELESSLKKKYRKDNNIQEMD